MLLGPCRKLAVTRYRRESQDTLSMLADSDSTEYLWQLDNSFTKWKSIGSAMWQAKPILEPESCCIHMSTFFLPTWSLCQHWATSGPEEAYYARQACCLNTTMQHSATRRKGLILNPLLLIRAFAKVERPKLTILYEGCESRMHFWMTNNIGQWGCNVRI